MGAKKQLTEFEKGKIEQLKKLNFSLRKIAEEVGRSKTVIANYLQNPIGYGTKSSPGRPKKLGPRTTKKIIDLASNKVISSPQIKHTLGLDVDRRTIVNVLNSSEILQFTKMQGKPPLSPDHKKARFQFAVDHVTWTKEWDYVIFSDEKKFNLDGPDGFHCYWHDLRKDPITFSKRVQGGGSVMIWLGFCVKKMTPLVYISTTMNAKDYTLLLNRNLIRFTNENFTEDFIFQHDNAPCHRAKSTQNWLEETGISVMDWPARSPDLNPIENLFGILSRRVYANGRQFERVEELKTAIEEAYASIETKTLEALIHSMPDRCKLVLMSQGGSINY